MWFVVLGVILTALKFFELGAVSVWPWWVVLLPFAFAIVWWSWADATGYTQRKAMDKMEDRKRLRRHKSLEALGIDPREHEKKRANIFKASRERATNKIEGKRDAQRKKNRDSVMSSRFHSTQQSSMFDEATQAQKPVTRTRKD